MTLAAAPLVAAVEWPAPILATAVIVIAVVTGLAAGVLALLDRSAPPWLLGLVLLVQLGFLVLGVVCVVAWIGGTAPSEPIVFVAYLVACLATPPALVWWGRGEPGRWGSGVIAIACLTLAVLVIRLQQVWTGVA